MNDDIIELFKYKVFTNHFTGCRRQNRRKHFLDGNFFEDRTLMMLLRIKNKLLNSSWKRSFESGLLFRKKYFSLLSSFIRKCFLQIMLSFPSGWMRKLVLPFSRIFLLACVLIPQKLSQDQLLWRAMVLHPSHHRVQNFNWWDEQL